MSFQVPDNDKITIVITSYNQKDFLVEAIESTLAQTLKPFEIIIADDCSTDGSPEIIKDYAKRYPSIIKPVFQEENLGVAKNRSSGFREAKGDLVTWANGDDRLLPRKLELELKTYQNNPEARWVYSQVLYVDASGRPTGVLRYGGKFKNRAYAFEDVLTKFGREPAYQLIERSVLDDVGLFDENLPIYEDWDFAIRLAKRFKPAYCPTPLYEYRQYKGGLSSADSETHLKALRKVYENILPLLEDIPEKEARIIKRRFAAEIFAFEALEKSKDGRRLDAGKYLIKALNTNPREIFYYEIGIMLFLPDIIIDQLRRAKKRYLAKLR